PDSEDWHHPGDAVRAAVRGRPITSIGRDLVVFPAGVAVGGLVQERAAVMEKGAGGVWPLRAHHGSVAGRA
ncbi:hypothetical protein AB0L05_17500, partial [Nonomuraea pusilla]|uniref:hypothetical protein n=1 Tax=Nonomuraea pusilla TaxID=46177 RepID=UPI00341D5BAB